MTAPNKIAEHRKALGLTQQQVAERIGIHWITVSKLERGKMKLSFERATEISKILGVTESELRSGATGYDYGTHECLDRTYLVMEMFSYVSEHPQVKANPHWAEMAEKAHHALWELYQAIGATSGDEAKEGA